MRGWCEVFNEIDRSFNLLSVATETLEFIAASKAFFVESARISHRLIELNCSPEKFLLFL